MRETVLPMLCTETKNLKGDDGDDDKIWALTLIVHYKLRNQPEIG